MDSAFPFVLCLLQRMHKLVVTRSNNRHFYVAQIQTSKAGVRMPFSNGKTMAKGVKIIREGMNSLVGRPIPLSYLQIFQLSG